MWTPRRILLLAAGFAVFLASYFLYAYFLGGIDGLPPLPDRYALVEETGPVSIPPPRENDTDKRLREAFGVDCDEVKNRTIKLELESKGMVLAARDIAFPDGRVELAPFSLAVFVHGKGGPGFPEINSVQCQRAILTFDKRVNNITQLNDSKIVAAELIGDIRVVNNRRTERRDDDLSLFTQGPLYYDESLHRIYTKADVRLTDPQTKPKPMTIFGTGMDIWLSNDTPPGKPAVASGKGAGQAPSKVDRVDLRRDVEMNLWVEGSGFLGSSKVGTENKPATTGKEPVPAEKSKVVIVTQGPFSYDLRTDRATFDIAKVAVARPDDVTVDRLNEAEGKLDHLRCDHLEIQFRRNTPAGPASAPAKDGRPEGLDIESVRATSILGKEVILTSDTEVLEAHGNDFYYDKRANRSTLKGEPHMWALKEGNHIEAAELQLVDQKGSQQATALGEGKIELLDRATGQRPLEARWKKKLVYAKEGTNDLLTLSGEALFMDREHNQQLQAELLKVWLEPANPQAKGKDAPHPRPRQLDAIGAVRATAPDMHIHDTERLMIWFKDGPTGQLPAVLPSGEASSTESLLPRLGSENPSLSDAAARPGAPRPETKPKPPIDLSAHLVVAHVSRAGQKNDLEKLWCEGSVRVLQDPTSPTERGVDIRGETLDLAHHLEGNVLVVTGTPSAQVQINTLFILGPEIHIDQLNNMAWVNGVGVMRMPSSTSFQGDKLNRPSEITINWEERMVFDGQYAKFQGGISAVQDSGRLACQVLQVTLDRRVSLREGDKGKAPAKVEKLVCDKNVWVEDVTREKGKIVALKRLECFELSLDNDNEKQDTLVKATGPGIVRIFQVGGTSDPLGSMASPGRTKPPGDARSQRPPTAAPQQADAGPKVTEVTFEGKMQANNTRGIATFFDTVTVVQVPATDPNIRFNKDRLPPEGMFLRSERLDVLNLKLPDGSVNREMNATGKVYLEGQGFSGTSELVKYNEAKEQIILEGSEGGLAVLEKRGAPGQEPKTFRGRKIIYYRLTGDIHGEGVRELSLSK